MKNYSDLVNMIMNLMLFPFAAKKSDNPNLIKNYPVFSL